MEFLNTLLTRMITSCGVVVTDFAPEGDRACLAGYNVFNNVVTFPLNTSIIKEDGQWKFYGNQIEVAPEGAPLQR
jgi:hypothetical protein